MSITHLYLFVIFVCAFIGVLRWRHFSTSVKVICTLVIYTFFSETATAYFHYQKQISLGYWAYHLYALVEFSILGWVYYHFIKIKNFQIAIKVIGIALLSWFFIAPFWIDMSSISAYNFRIESFWVILLTLGYFYYLLKQDEYIPLKDLSAYWISIGLFIFYIGNTLLFSTIGYMYDLNKELAEQMFNWLNNGLNMFMYVMFSIAFYAKR